MKSLPTQYFLSSISFKHGFLITFFPSKTLLQTLAAIWVVALMHYNCVFPKVTICGYLNIDISCDITTKTKRINQIHQNKIYTNDIYLHLLETFSELSTFFLMYNSLKLALSCQNWIYNIPRKFQRGTTMLISSLLWLQSPSQVVTQYPLLLDSPKIETSNS